MKSLFLFCFFFVFITFGSLLSVFYWNLAVIYGEIKTFNKSLSSSLSIVSKFLKLQSIQRVYRLTLPSILCFVLNVFVNINPTQDEGGGQKVPPTSFSSVTSVNVGISP